jgi:hypothetical protein
VTVLRSTGYAETGCNPETNAERVARWEVRRMAWLADQPDPMAAEVERGRQHAKGVALQKSLRKRKRVKAKARKSTPTTTNVVTLRKRCAS